MTKTSNQKIKLLKILEILKSDSDENNPLSTNELILRLREDNIECGRKALYDDISLLNEYGYEILTIKSKQNLYYVVDRTFDIPELRILVDAIQSASFITKKKTKELANKIYALAGTHKAVMLKNTTVHFDTLKHTNEHIYYSIDAIDRAKNTNKQISFCYFDLSLNGKKLYRRNMERYIVNPVGLIFSNGFYYFVAYSDKRQTLTNYRVDRMDNVNIEESEIITAPCVKDFNLYKEQNLAFGMFAGENESVTLYVHNSLTDIIFDKFGTNIPLNKADDEHFTVSKVVQISPVFLSWCAMFGDKLKIISPKKVIDQFINEISIAINQYK